MRGPAARVGLRADLADAERRPEPPHDLRGVAPAAGVEGPEAVGAGEEVGRPRGAGPRQERRLHAGLRGDAGQDVLAGRQVRQRLARQPAPAAASPIADRTPAASRPRRRAAPAAAPTAPPVPVGIQPRCAWGLRNPPIRQATSNAATAAAAKSSPEAIRRPPRRPRGAPERSPPRRARGRGRGSRPTRTSGRRPRWRRPPREAERAAPSPRRTPRPPRPRRRARWRRGGTTARGTRRRPPPPCRAAGGRTPPAPSRRPPRSGDPPHGPPGGASTDMRHSLGSRAAARPPPVPRTTVRLRPEARDCNDRRADAASVRRSRGRRDGPARAPYSGRSRRCSGTRSDGRSSPPRWRRCRLRRRGRTTRRGARPGTRAGPARRRRNGARRRTGATRGRCWRWAGRS